MKAQDLKVGSKVKDLTSKFIGEVYKTTDAYVWFKGMGYSRIKRTTIDKYSTLYKIISI